MIITNNSVSSFFGRLWFSILHQQRARKSRTRRATVLVIGSCFFCLMLFPGMATGQAGPASPVLTADSLAGALSAASQGDAQTQLRLGQAYAEGTAGPRNYGEALKWLQAASSQGSVEATAWLGSLYLLGHGVQRDLIRAASLIQPAAAAGNSAGLRFMGLMYETGQGVPRDYSQAVSRYTQAVAQQDGPACDRLGILYLHGLGVKRDRAKAFALFTQGANLGDRWAQLHLGQMYQSGRIPHPQDQAATGSKKGNSKTFLKSTPDYATALKLYQASAAQRNGIAMYKLGALYENGWGVTKDDSKALEYYTQAASQRFNPALVAFGRMYELGLGAAVNLPYAYIGYSLAAESGDSNASEHLRSLLTKLSPDDLQNAQAMLKAARHPALSPNTGSN
jgi:uncharacterized protein